MLKGRQSGSNRFYECTGVVLATGNEVIDLPGGCWVVCLTNCQFESLVTVGRGSCLTVETKESVTALSGLLVPTCMAILALEQIPKLTGGEVRNILAQTFTYPANT